MQVDRRVEGLDADAVLVDNEAGARERRLPPDRGGAHADRHPHRRARGADREPAARRLRARAEGARHRRSASPSIKSGSFHREHAIEDATELIRAQPAPTAIFAANNILAEATLIALDQQGLRVPRDVSVVAFDDVQWMSMVEPPLTTVRQPRRRHGAERRRARAAPAPRGSRGSAEHGRLPDRAGRARLGRAGPEAARLAKAASATVSVAIGVDVGTTGARAVAVDEHGGVVARRARPSTRCSRRGRSGPSRTRRSGGARPARCSAAVAERRAGDAGHAVVGIGLTGQMHGSVFLDAAGEVIRPALLWNDQRTGEQCEEITDRVGAERLVEITGNPALTGFQAPKVLWLRDEEPRALRARRDTCCCRRTTSGSG